MIEWLVRYPAGALLLGLVSANGYPRETRPAGPVVLYAAPEGAGVACTEKHPCSIYAAREKVRTLNQNMQADVVVYLRGGEYWLSRTWEFGAGDSGSNGFYVVYRAYPGETPRLKGGQPVGQWSPAGNGIYQAPVGLRAFRQLYINGVRATRSRYPNGGSYFRLLGWDEQEEKLIVGEGEGPGPLGAEKGVEMVITRGWEWTRMRIAALENQAGSLGAVTAEPERTRVFGAQPFLRYANQPFYYENDLRFLDVAGEWYLDPAEGTVYYKPFPCEDLDKAVVIAPALQTLLSVKGEASGNGLITPVQNLRFEGLTFEYTTWLDPSREGYFGEQAGSYFVGTEAVNTVPGCIEVEAARGIELADNVLRHLAADGISMGRFNQGNRLTGNVLYDAGCNGISINRPADPAAVSRAEVVRNNYITRVAREYSGVGIFAAYAENLLVEHNELFDLPYSGISVGWGWTDAPSTLRNNTIRRNYVHHVMRELSDGGAIYLLSRQPGTVVAGNYLHDIFRSPWSQPGPAAGVYLDNGSSQITVEDNRIERVQDPVYEQTIGLPAYDNTIRNTPEGGADETARAGLEPFYGARKGEMAEEVLLNCRVQGSGTGWPPTIMPPPAWMNRFSPGWTLSWIFPFPGQRGERFHWQRGRCGGRDTWSPVFRKRIRCT
jgi:hypothetical protein